jgi:Mycolic acid cyclopropane synthetase
MKRRPAMLVCGALLIPLLLWAADYPEEIPFVPTPLAVVDEMLALAEVKQGDMLYDLGSGDGRIVIRAAQKYRIRAVASKWADCS